MRKLFLKCILYRLLRALSEEMIGLRGKRSKKVCLETLYASVFLKSGVPSFCDNRDPGVDCWWAEAWNASCCAGAASGSAEFTVESHELSGIDTQSREAKLSSGSDLCWLWLRPRGAIILQQDCEHSSADPKLIWGGHFTNNLPLWRQQRKVFTHLL